MKRDPNNPEELRQEILLYVEEGEMRVWARRVTNRGDADGRRHPAYDLDLEQGVENEPQSVDEGLMKREAITHTKMKRLCRRLALSLWQAVGLLGTISHLTARGNAARESIGKLSDEDIALGIDYRGNEVRLGRSAWLNQAGAITRSTQ